MKRKCNKIFIFLFIMCSMIHGMENSAVSSAPRLLNAIIIFEQGDSENAYSKSRALLVNLQNALRQKAAPILVTGAILHSLQFLSEKFRTEIQKNPTLIKNVDDLMQERKDIDRALQPIERELSHIKRQEEEVQQEIALLDSQKEKIQIEIDDINRQKEEVREEKSRLNRERYAIKKTAEENWKMLKKTNKLTTEEVYLLPHRLSYEAFLNEQLRKLGDTQYAQYIKLGKLQEVQDEKIRTLDELLLIPRGKINELSKQKNVLLEKEQRLDDKYKIESIKKDAEEDKKSISSKKLDAITDSIAVDEYCSYITPFDFKEWDVFKHVSSDIYLLIPKAYEAQINQAWQSLKKEKQQGIDELIRQKNITEKELMLGFMVDHQKMLKKISNMQQLNTKLKRSWESREFKFSLFNTDFAIHLGSNRSTMIEHLISFFVWGKSDNLFGLWNIYVVGHGGETKVLSPSSSKEKMINQDAQIAGLTLSEFGQLLTFLSNNIKTNVFYWDTCFGGGYHLNLVVKLLNHLKMVKEIEDNESAIFKSTSSNDFIAISGALTDATTSIFGSIESCSTGNNVVDFKKFFDGCTLLALDVAKHRKLVGMQNIDPKRRDQFLKTLLMPFIIPALKAVTPELSGSSWIYSIPSIYISGGEKFRVPEFSPTIAILDKKYLLRNHNKPIELANKRVILFYENNINNPIRIISKGYVYTVPQFISMNTENPHYQLKELSLQSKYSDENLKEFLKKAIFNSKILYDVLYKVEAIKGIIFEYEPGKTVNELKDVVIFRGRRPMGNKMDLVLFSIQDSNDSIRFFKGHRFSEVKIEYDDEISFQEVSASAAQEEKRKVENVKELEKILGPR